jgi:catecholate siderophore receptor
LLVGARYDNFDLSALDGNANIRRNRTDDFISPRAAVIVKPMDSMSLYTAWSVRRICRLRAISSAH